jgi:preprotein translocase subunit SecG
MILSIGFILFCILLIGVVLMQTSEGGLRSQTVKQITGIKKAGVFAEKQHGHWQFWQCCLQY